MITIREHGPLDLDGLLRVEKEAFGPGEGPEIVELIENLFDDPTAAPYLSLMALAGGEPVGHILFTAARLEGHAGQKELSVAILAPLAVLPSAQNRGIGGRLVEEGAARMAKNGYALLFVLGHPGYYPRFGFRQALPLCVEAPYPLTGQAAPAWMVRELKGGLLGTVKGKIHCAKAMDRPEYWQE